MKKLVKITALILAVMMAVFCFAGCGSEDKKNDENNAPAASEAPAQKDAEEVKNVEADGKNVKTDGVLKMGTNAAFPPYEFKEGEKFVGIDVEIAKAIAEKLGKELEIVDMEFDSIIPAVNGGEVDMGIAGMTVTDERLEQVEFSSSYATGVQVVIVTENSSITSIDDLAGKKIGTQLGTTGDIYSKDDYGAENVTSYGKGADAVIALMGGDVDAVIIDNEPAKAFVAQNAGLKILETEYAVEDYAIAIAKGNTELLDQVNTALKELVKDGTIDAIIEKYISAE